jgi:hypothetical protein
MTNSKKDLILRSYLKTLCRKHRIKFIAEYLPTLRLHQSRYCWPEDYFMVVDVLASLTNLSRLEYRQILKHVEKIISNGHHIIDKKNRRL